MYESEVLVMRVVSPGAYTPPPSEKEHCKCEKKRREKERENRSDSEGVPLPRSQQRVCRLIVSKQYRSELEQFRVRAPLLVLSSPALEAHSVLPSSSAAPSVHYGLEFPFRLIALAVYGLRASKCTSREEGVVILHIAP